MASKLTNLTPKKARKSRRPWKLRFLEQLRKVPNVSAAAQAAGISRQQAYDIRETDETFAKEWNDAIEQAVDQLVGKAWGRAKGGKSDLLTIFLLKSHRPEIYRETVRAEHTGANGAMLVPISFIEAVVPAAPAAAPVSAETPAPEPTGGQ